MTTPPEPPRGSRGARRPGRYVLFGLLLVLGLSGLAVAAIGIAHGMLPRQFTAAQRRQITDWEMARRWRALTAGEIFPAAVSYTVSAGDLNATTGLTLRAQRLAISPAEGCSKAFDTAADRVLSQHRCTSVLRATYVDSSGSMVATIAVAVLPTGATASSVVGELAGASNGAAGSLQAFAVPGTPAAGFTDADRQVSRAIGAGPYLILATAGFTTERHQQVSADQYVSREMLSFADGLVTSAQGAVGKQPPVPSCPGAPGC
ncbi:MAG: hypothetical protein J2P28_09835 [Actinobacteria bacterium]|nr:hypothetical protein [Actinomycetota bacterium]MBO0835806.1 hypothetical protein [Actinomycetota bacterium]